MVQQNVAVLNLLEDVCRVPIHAQLARRLRKEGPELPIGKQRQPTGRETRGERDRLDLDEVNRAAQ